LIPSAPNLCGMQQRFLKRYCEQTAPGQNLFTDSSNFAISRQNTCMHYKIVLRGVTSMAEKVIIYGKGG
jgi:hypothetical protein